ncbi:MAG: carboxypeptidase regulatory-like domain-containing protein [Acidobacteria bacterium]|nr:carboxypeptidase regulatory-like domain-containing protein [Acidobacteriota bacterium]
MKLLSRSLGILILMGLPVLAFAQTGSISGIVTDKSGAVVADATVSAKNMATGFTRATQSSGSGSYAIGNLPIGTYAVTMEKSGFRPLRYNNVSVSVAQVVPLNGEFEVGAVQETVTVSTETTAPVETETSQISNLVDARRIKDLPLLTRNPYDLLLLSPGTASTAALGGYTVNGSRERNNNFLLDGVDNNDTSVPGGTGSIVLSSNPESTEEFRVITNAFSAEFGRNTGAIVDVVTKSGTNALHADAYWFGRYNGFGGARDWFNSDGPMNPYVRNQFGYSIGGPIRKNKTFFFFNNEFQRFRTTLTNTATVPTDAFKAGIFTWHTFDTNQQPIDVNVDLTPSSAQNAFGLPLDPTMAQIFALYPEPTQLNPDGYSGQVFFPSSDAQDSYQTVLKVDHHFNDRHTLTLRYGYDYGKNPNSGHADVLPGGVGGVGVKSISQALAANLSSTLTPNLLNTFVFGWNRINVPFTCQGTDVLDSVSPLDRFGNGADYTFGTFTSFGCIALAANGQDRRTGTTSYSDTLSWVHGAHNLKFGFEFRNVGESGSSNFFSRRQVNTLVATNAPVFNPVDISGVDDGELLQLGDAASALYGFVLNDLTGEFFDKNGVRQATDNKFFRQHEYAGFVQDSWKVRRTLTLNLGLRYQFNGVPYEEQGNFSNLLTDPAAYPVVMSIVGPGTGKQIYRNDFSNIEPRVGFSWDPRGDGKTAIRGAFGIFHDRVFGNLFGNARGNPPFEQDYNTFPLQTVNNYLPVGGSLSGIPDVVGDYPVNVPDTTPSPIIPDGALLAPIIFDPHFRNSSSNNWNFGIQHELPGNMVIDLNYVGSKGTHIFRQVDGNPPVPELVDQLVTYCSDPGNEFGCTPEDVTGIALYEGADQFGILPFNAVEHNALVQPFYQRSVGNSIYNAMQLKVTRRYSHGFQIQGSYTWAHGIDDSVDPLNPNAGNRTYPRNSLNLRQDRGNSDNDIRHIGVINYIYELPLGKGRRFLSSGALGRVFEGIQFSGITTAETGHPFEVRGTRDSQRTGVSAWAQLVGDPFAAPGSGCAASGGKAFFTNTCAFALPPWGFASNIGKNAFYGPNYVNFDLSISKKMKFGERVGLETRFEAFNIFNHPQFTNPGADAASLGNLLGSPIFGAITSTVTRQDGTTSARQIQVAMKLSF